MLPTRTIYILRAGPVDCRRHRAASADVGGGGPAGGLADDADLQSILTSSIELGKRLRMTVVAEGVERWADWRLLERLGCDQIQGYIASLPIAASDIPAFVRRWTERAA